MHRKLLLSATLLLVAGVSGCEREPRTAREELAITAQEEPGFRTEEPAPLTPVPDTAADQTIFGNLAEMGNSGASGTVTLRAKDGQTEVMLSVTGAQPNTSIVPTIHEGACAEAGTLREQLSAVRVEETGLASATLRASVPFAALADGRHSVRVYPEAGTTGVPPIACAEVPTRAAPGRM